MCSRGNFDACFLAADCRDFDFAAKRRLLEGVATAHGTGLDALALAGVLAQPWVDVVLSGAASLEQLQSNARAVSLELDGEAEMLLRTLAEPAGEYWRRRAALAWN